MCIGSKVVNFGHRLDLRGTNIQTEPKLRARCVIILSGKSIKFFWYFWSFFNIKNFDKYGLKDGRSIQSLYWWCGKHSELNQMSGISEINFFSRKNTYLI